MFGLFIQPTSVLIILRVDSNLGTRGHEAGADNRMPSSQEAVNNLDFGLDGKDERELFGGRTGLAVCSLKVGMFHHGSQGCMSQPEGIIFFFGPMRDQNTEKPRQPG